MGGRLLLLAGVLIVALALAPSTALADTYEVPSQYPTIAGAPAAGNQATITPRLRVT